MLRFISNNDGTCYVDFDCGLRPDTARKVEIPKYSPSGDLVTEICKRAFYNCTTLKSIIIPTSVTSIGYEAFRGCTGLKSITIPTSVTSIGHGAFSSCTGLKSITIPDSVKYLSYRVFNNCTGLKSITIPTSVTSIGDYAFENCISLKSITIPNSVTRIGESAFHGCDNLKSVTIGDSMERIGGDAFTACPKLKFSLYEDVKYLGNNDNPYIALISSADPDILFCAIHPQTKILADDAFWGCNKLRDVIIPNTVKSISNNAFYKCTHLRDITIPSSVTNIGARAFCGCTRLTSVIIPDSVKSIDCEAFSGCTSLVKKAAIKATKGDMTCRGFQYEVGKWYHEDKAELCKSGFHYVENAFDVFTYYCGEICKEVRFFKVKAKGKSSEILNDSKRVCKDICLYEEITSYRELLN